MRLLIVQYAGDYREVFQRLSQGGGETYHAQKYVIDAIGEIGKQIEEATFFCCKTKESYNEVLQDGLRAIGAGLDPYQDTKKVIELIEQQNPTHLVIHFPFTALFQWAIKKQVRTVGLLADSFLRKGFRRRLKNYSFARLLNNQQIEWIGNHGINACLSLQEIGVNPNKIIPWDWPHVINPSYFPPKYLPMNVNTFNLVYVGAILKDKGVGDIIEAVAWLKNKNFTVNLQVAGKGEIDYFANQVRQLNIEENVKFLGLVSHDKVIDLMRKADMVLVPSWHEYQEGFPLTIYEAFCARTPIVASDHPMFMGNLQHGINAMVFPARNSKALAICVEKLLSDPELYHSLSLNSEAAWNQLQIPVKWAEFINRWLNVNNTDENQHWLIEHSLASGRYKSRLSNKV